MPPNNPTNHHAEFAPQYLTVVLALQKAMRNHELLPGQRLPSVRDLATQFDMNRNVVHYALLQLAENGLIFSRPGSGYYVGSRTLPGYFHRVAYVLNEVNPMHCSQTIDGVFQVAGGYGFEPVLISNYWSRQSIREMLEQDNNFDGMVINGTNITDKFLNDIGRFKIPYIVYGYRDIEASHPQMDNSQAVQKVRRKLGRLFRGQFRKRRMGALFGDSNALSSRIYREGFRLAAEDSGIDISQPLIKQCENDGGHEFKMMFENDNIDTVFLYGLPMQGYLRYFFENPDQVASRPYSLAVSTVYNKEAFALLPKLFDKVIYSSGRQLALATTKELFARILPAEVKKNIRGLHRP